MQVSIIIPVLNEAQSIERQLQALQPYRNCCEIILVDGGSSDDTTVVSEPLVDKVLQASRGRASQMNRGAQQAVGKWLVFLHADTQLPNDFSSQLFTTIEEKYFWGFFRVKLSGKHWILRVVEAFMNWRSKLTHIATGDQTVFVRSAAFMQVGGFPHIPLMEDVALATLLKRASLPHVIKSPVTTSSRRWEENGIFKTILLMWWLRFRFFCGANPADLAKVYYPHLKTDGQ